MLFSMALEKALYGSDAPVVTEYDIYRMGLKLFTDETYEDSVLKRIPDEWGRAETQTAVRRLVKKQALAKDQDFKSGVWRVVQSSTGGTAEDIACLVDPFCYVSHLSAMQRYGLTDRSPQALHLTTPARPVWNQLRDKKQMQELGVTGEDGKAFLTKVGFNETIRRRPVIVHESKHPLASIKLRGEGTRVSTIGETFVEMMSEPNLCGGIRHGLDIWERHAAAWLDAIIDAVSATDSKIVKVRAGYILSERLTIDDARIEAWKAFAQRGGSRKMDPDAPYAPTFSEQWMISLNV